MRITGTGSYVPSTTLSNDDISKFVETDDEWITQRTGIKSRYISRDENTSDLAYEASLKAIEKANINPSEIDLIIVATMSADSFMPAVANIVQKKLNIESAMSFDINVACSGFVYALSIAKSLMDSGKFKYALVIGAEVISKLTDWTDRNTCILFGDGAGAVVLENFSDSHLLYTNCTAQPDRDNVLYTGGVPIVNPLFKQESNNYCIAMNGQEVFRFAIDVITDSINKLLTETKISLKDIDYIVCHQANYRIIKKVAKDLDLSESSFYINLDEYGNTSAASIPIALDEMNQKGLLQQGMKIIFVGFGAGLTWGCTLIKW